VVLPWRSPHALGPIGHEFIGVVEQVGTDVHGIKKGALVVAPFTYCDGTCANCRAGWPSNCIHGGSFGNHGIDGGQGEVVRVPLADATLVSVPGSGHSDETMVSLLTLSDVICTGHHAAVSAVPIERLSEVDRAGEKVVSRAARETR
jgi:threonine dehydrogenase-like Zn-dependent dehydrogenase